MILGREHGKGKDPEVGAILRLRRPACYGIIAKMDKKASHRIRKRRVQLCRLF